jgi:TonB family protein
MGVVCRPFSLIMNSIFEIKRKVSAALIIFTIACFTCVGPRAQETNPQSPERDRGIQLYKQGDFDGAIKSLREAIKRDKDDVTAWHYLGAAFTQKGNRDEASKAHEKAARIAEEQASYLLDRQAIYPDKPVSLPKPRLLDGAESADQYLALSRKLSEKNIREWTSRAQFLRMLGSDASGMEVYSSREVTTKVKILSKPLPTYTEEARRNRVNGRVVLGALFGPDGQVRAVRVIRGLPDGLTRVAIEAVQQIKFIAATKDGKPVSQWLDVEYGFNVY